MGWVAKRGKTCFDSRANLILTKVSARKRKSRQVHPSSGQKESQVYPSFQLTSTCDSVWPGLNAWRFYSSRGDPLGVKGLNCIEEAVRYNFSCIMDHAFGGHPRYQQSFQCFFFVLSNPSLFLIQVTMIDLVMVWYDFPRQS